MGPSSAGLQSRLAGTCATLLAAVLLLVSSTACSAAPATSAPDAAPNVNANIDANIVQNISKDVRTVMSAQVDAWNRGDLESFMAGYWKSPDLVFFSNGAETRGWQATLDRYRSRYQTGGKQMGTLDFPDLDVLALGPEAAMARGRWRLKMPDGKESSGMTSVVFRKLPEGWRIVHDHSSAEGS